MSGSIGSIVGGIGGSLIGGPAGGAIGSQLGGSLFGGGGGSSSTSGGPSLLPFTGGGLSLRFVNGKARLTEAEGSQRRSAVDALKASLLQQAGDIRGIFAPGIASAFGEGIGGIQGLLERVSPGFGELTKARVSTLTNRGAAAKSDLRANLARRRVLGSSFAQDVQNRQEQQLSQDIAEARAVSLLEELDVTNQLLAQKTSLSIGAAESALQTSAAAFAAEQGASQVEIDEQNAQLEVITQLISGATSQIGANARLEAVLAAQSAEGRGASAANLGSSIGSLFGGGGGGGIPSSESLLAFGT